MTQLDFTKMHGLGNDFIVIEHDGRTPLPTTEDWRRLADRHTGIGFDQALVLQPPRDAATCVYYRIFNSDGGEVQQCGNGARCIAAYLQRRGRVPAGELHMDSAGGRVIARIADHGNVAVDMGLPNFEPSALPFEAAAKAPSYQLELAGDTVEIGAVSLGNPHAVLQVASVAAAPVASLGPAIQQHARFPQRVNVGFMEIAARDHIRLRVFERGAGETLACGTGACAAVAIARQRQLVDTDVQVDLPGGRLEVSWPSPTDHIWLKGPTAVSFTGTVAL
ncbi:MAG TPA: diaminopimelate epimerase [Steroidobacteraceae bacterium]|nr:diaminopimelate epimerase [Steroidobacteraceae bacterium]HRX88539.1 diaminopimelate epimerase [Steroidobacteraceae bacterium]